jgi:hypothetical protein
LPSWRHDIKPCEVTLKLDAVMTVNGAQPRIYPLGSFNAFTGHIGGDTKELFNEPLGMGYPT